MVSTQKLFSNFVNGLTTNNKTDKKSNSCFIENNAVYSYGYHFPLCVRLLNNNSEFVFLVNTSKYSMTTSKHQTFLNRELLGFRTFNTTTEKLKSIINNDTKTFNELILNEIS